MDRSVAARLPARLSRLSFAVSLATAALFASLAIEHAEAACTPALPGAGASVSCSGQASLLGGTNSFSSSANNLNVTVVGGTTMGAPLLGAGMSLTGNNITFTNNGLIDPSVLGLIGGLTTGTIIGNTSNASTVVINNNASGVLKGTGGLLSANLLNLNGMALDVRNGAGGTTVINNAGTIGSDALASASVLTQDIPVIAVQGGGSVNMTNTGSIVGRAAFQAANSGGNTFTNAGSITGSLSMGANSTNRFNAITGSSVSAGGGVGVELLVSSNPNLAFAAAGVIDGGAGGTNTLALQNAIGGGSGTTGTGSINAANYINFNRLIVDSGTWSLIG